jgi:hypothetical protein
MEVYCAVVAVCKLRSTQYGRCASRLREHSIWRCIAPLLLFVSHVAHNMAAVRLD